MTPKIAERAPLSANPALNLIRKAAPTAASAISGPMAGTAVALIAGKLGVEPSVPAIARELSENPEATARLAEIEADMARASMLDTQHARQTFGAHWAIMALTAVLLGMFGAQAAILTLVEIPASNRDVITLLAGQVSGFAAVAYWLGPVATRGR